MKVVLKIAFDEPELLRLLQFVAEANGRLLGDRLRQGIPLPLLYDSGVLYGMEKEETWGDALSALTQGWEDCDGLAAWRVGELLAHGANALAPGEGGYRAAQRQGLDSIPAQVLFTTRSSPRNPGQYHCIARYWVDGREYRDDPSARLGMIRGRIDPRVRSRWEALGVRPRTDLAADPNWKAPADPNWRVAS